MRNHRNPQARVSNKTHADNFDPGDALELLRAELANVEALAHAAGEAVTMLPSTSSTRLRRTFTRLYALVTRTANEASSVLELSEHLVSLLASHLADPPATREVEDRPPPK